MEEHEERATNDLIERLATRLSQEGKKVLEDFEHIGDAFVRGRISEGVAEVREEAVLERLDYLSEQDRGIILHLFELKAHANHVEAEKHGETARVATEAAAAIERAQELQRAEGKEPRPSMTVGEALEVLQRHGELN